MSAPAAASSSSSSSSCAATAAATAAAPIQQQRPPLRHIFDHDFVQVLTANSVRPDLFVEDAEEVEEQRQHPILASIHLFDTHRETEAKHRAHMIELKAEGGFNGTTDVAFDNPDATLDTKTLFEPKMNNQSVCALAFDSIGRHLAIAGSGGALSVFRVCDATCLGNSLLLWRFDGQEESDAQRQQRRYVDGYLTPEEPTYADGQRRLRVLNGLGQITHQLAFSRDGCYLAASTQTARGKQYVLVWSALTGIQLRRISFDRLVQGLRGHCRKIAWTEDFLIVSSDENVDSGAFGRFSPKVQNCTRFYGSHNSQFDRIGHHFSLHSAGVEHLAVSPADGGLLLSVSFAKNFDDTSGAPLVSQPHVTLFRVGPLPAEATIKNHERARHINVSGLVRHVRTLNALQKSKITHVSFSPCGTKIAACSERDLTTTVVSVGTGEILYKMVNARVKPTKVLFVQGGEYLMVRSGMTLRFVKPEFQRGQPNDAAAVAAASALAARQSCSPISGDFPDPSLAMCNVAASPDGSTIVLSDNQQQSRVRCFHFVVGEKLEDEFHHASPVLETQLVAVDRSKGPAISVRCCDKNDDATIGPPQWPKRKPPPSAKSDAFSFSLHDLMDK